MSDRADKPLSVGPRVFKNIGRLFTLEGAMSKGGRRVLVSDLSPIDKAAIVESKGRIVWLGKEADLPQHYANADLVENLLGASVVPAFIESHTHLIFAGNRAGEFERRLRGESYASIAASGGGIVATVNPTRASSIEDLVVLGQKRVENFVRQGVTTIECKSGYGLSLESETKLLEAAGLLERARIVRTFLGAHAVPAEFSGSKAYLDFLEANALPEIARRGLASRVDIFVEKNYFSVPDARQFLLTAKQLGFNIAVHADQLTRSGAAALAVEVGAHSAEHLINISSTDVDALAKSNVTCVLLPAADLYMRCAYPPARRLIDAGARVALATDFNPGTSPTQDLALVGLLARLEMQMTLAETLCAYTVAPAYALGLEADLGALTVGRFCDFAVLDNTIDEIFFQVGRMGVAKVIREGVALY